MKNLILPFFALTLALPSVLFASTDLVYKKQIVGYGGSCKDANTSLSTKLEQYQNDASVIKIEIADCGIDGVGLFPIESLSPSQKATIFIKIDSVSEATASSQ